MDQNVPPGPNTPDDFIIPESVTNKPGGKPNLALLTNMTMETFFQKGNQDAANLIENYNGKTNFQVFGTESCMGCHSSAGIYDHIGPKNGKKGAPLVAQTGGQLSADFSWLMGKAKWLDNIPIIQGQ